VLPAFLTLDHDVHQGHPLHGQDRAIVDRLVSVQQPQAQDIADCGRLFIRYEGYPGAYDIQAGLEHALSRWRMNRDELNRRCRELWAGGWRPTIDDASEIGSGADVNAA
jgi:type II secretory pathway component PulJ